MSAATETKTPAAATGKNEAHGSSEEKKDGVQASNFWNLMKEVPVLYWLCVFIPIAIGLRFGTKNSAAIFITSCLGLVPLAGMMGDATEVIADAMGPGIGGLLNATFGNAAELILALFGVFRNLDVLVKSSLTGSVISNILLVLGASIVAGGLKFGGVQEFSLMNASLGSTMCVFAAIAILIPALHFSINNGAHDKGLSLGVSICMILTYIATLVFQLYTHRKYYDGSDGGDDKEEKKEDGKENSSSSSSSSAPAQRTGTLPLLTEKEKMMAAEKTATVHSDGGTISDGGVGAHLSPSASTSKLRADSFGTRTSNGHTIFHMGPRRASKIDFFFPPIMTTSQANMQLNAMRKESNANAMAIAATMSANGVTLTNTVPAPVEEEEAEEPPFTVRTAMIVLSVTCGLVALLSEGLTSAVEDAGKSLGLSETFMGVIIVAIVGNAAEHSTSVLMAMKNKMDISVGIAFGSAMQIAMFVIPIAVIVSYGRAGEPMDLLFSQFEVISVSVSVVLAWMVVSDGRSHWMEGLLMLVLYTIIGMGFYYLSDDAINT